MDAKFVHWVGVFAMLSLFSCGSNSPEKLLIGRWKTVALENAGFERQAADTRQYIDTLGNADPTLRNSLDLDSLKAALRADFEQALQAQATALENTLMEFRANGVAYTTSIDGVDSALYKVEEGQIRIDEAGLKGHGESMTFTILTLEQDTLKVRLVDYGDTSVATMVRAR